VGTFETMMLVALGIALTILLVPPRLRTGPFAILEVAMPVGAAVAFQIHALVEGPERALLPVYALGFALLAITALRFLYLRPQAPKDPHAPGAATDPGSEPPPGLPRGLELAGVAAGLAVLVWAVIQR
jgi:hypothetical protein